MFIVKKIVVTLCLLGALAVVAVGQASPAQMNMSIPGATQEKKSLYQRLGGYDAIAAVVDDFITRLATDPRFERFFSGSSIDSKKRLRQHILDQFCAAAGGPCVYTGREMKTAHTGLKISEDDWNSAARLRGLMTIIASNLGFRCSTPGFMLSSAPQASRVFSTDFRDARH